MGKYILLHEDADTPMVVEASTAAKAKYQNFRDWSEVFDVRLPPGGSKFREYLKGLKSCKRCMAALSEGGGEA